MSDEWEKCPYCGSEVWIIYHAEDNSIMRCKNCGKIFDGNQVREMKNKKSIAELEAERDRLKEALREIAEMEAGSHEPSFEMRGCMTSESCMHCDEMINIARAALEGAGE